MWKTALVKIEKTRNGDAITIKYVGPKDESDPEYSLYKRNVRVNGSNVLVYFIFEIDTTRRESRAMLMDYISNYLT